jgi:hypothetical protein
VADYVTSYQNEATRRSLSQSPSVIDFINHRRDSGAMHIVFDVLEPTYHVEIPPEWFNSREFQDVYLAADDIVCWDNDVASARKELARNDFHSLPLVIHEAADGGLQVAMHRAADMIHARAQYYIAAERLLEHLLATSDLDSTVADGIRCFAAGLRDWMRANHDFGAVTGRYHDIVHTLPGIAPHYIEPLLDRD